jgi:hypothetical protein
MAMLYYLEIMNGNIYNPSTANFETFNFHELFCNIDKISIVIKALEVRA